MNIVVLLNASLNGSVLFQNRDVGFISNLYFLGDSPPTDHYPINNSCQIIMPPPPCGRLKWLELAHQLATQPLLLHLVCPMWPSLVSENYLGKIGRHVFLCQLKTIFLINFPSRRIFNRLESPSDRFKNTITGTFWHNIFAHTSENFITSETAVSGNFSLDTR